MRLLMRKGWKVIPALGFQWLAMAKSDLAKRLILDNHNATMLNGLKWLTNHVH